MSGLSADQLSRWLANEMVWAADRVERDRNPGPLEPMLFLNPADAPENLEPVWLLPSLLVKIASDHLDTEDQTGEIMPMKS